MKNEIAYPPNFLNIQTILNPTKGMVYAYGDTIYNPDNIPLYEDLIKHEEVHREQQKKFGSVELWWYEYLTNPEFRLEQELEAYGVQANFLKFLPDKVWKEAVNELAKQLSMMYNLDIGIREAEAEIKRQVKLLSVN